MKVSEAFDLIRQYAERENWIPIEVRQWQVGPWAITVNGTPEKHDGIPAFHALVTHKDLLGCLLIHPFGGRVAGPQGTEQAFIEAMTRALRRSR